MKPSICCPPPKVHPGIGFSPDKEASEIKFVEKGSKSMFLKPLIEVLSAF